MPRWTVRTVVSKALVICFVSTSAAADDEDRAKLEFFEKKIRPLLVEKCYECHSGETREGNLRVDRRDHLIQGGRSGRAILPSEPNGSLLIRAIRRLDQDLKMPPEDKDQLTREQIQDFVTWVKAGAVFPADEAGESLLKPQIDLETARKFWSFQPIRRPTVPLRTDRAWPRNEIDDFVLAKLRAQEMSPSPLADRATLLRRLTYDVTGLPPTLAEREAFLADTSSDAYEKVVDRLLDSPRYGEHWARHWLDVARYGDTRWVGAGEDRRWPFAYTYRDWVVNALNADVPYDRFVSLQLAADQMEEVNLSDHAALGFLTVGRWFTGQLPDVIDDQIDVVTRGLMGLTVQCARCHNHKYDPVSAQDYYSLYGLFAAARMPVDGSGFLAELPDVSERPIEEAKEQEIAALRREVDEFLQNRLTQVRAEFRTRESLLKYFPAAARQLAQPDNEVRAFAKAQQLDERKLMRWVRYLKNTLKTPHPIFAPWHALALIPEAEFSKLAPAVIEVERVDKEGAQKLNSHIKELLATPVDSFAELSQRYVELFLKYDAAEMNSDAEQEAIRLVLRGNDSPAQISLGELAQFMPAETMSQLVELRRRLFAKCAELSERADFFVTYQQEAAPLVKDISIFLQQRRDAVIKENRTADKIAAYLLATRDAETLSEGQFRSLAKGRQLSERMLRRWMDFLQSKSQENNSFFAAWHAYAEIGDKDFDKKTTQVAERLKSSAGLAAVSAILAEPPATMAEVAKRYADLIIQGIENETPGDAAHTWIRQQFLTDDSPLQISPQDAVDYFSQKDLDELKNKERKLARHYLDSPGSPPRAMTLRDSRRGYEQKVFVRGNPNVPGELSHGGFLKVLSTDTASRFAQGRGRLELAQSIVDRKNPLTARVIVNRVWQWHFGAGLVRTPSDFGTRGMPPSHPELLDWLADEFISGGWSLKKLHRKILLSATWQQSSQGNAQFQAVDPENQWLWRASRRRLGFEETRDSLLVAGGRLDVRSGGKPGDLVKNLHRQRSLYGTIDRVVLPGFYRYFDFPSPDSHVAERHETIVAQQALYLMNHPFVMEQATHAARFVAGLNEVSSTARVAAIYQQILGRKPTAAERSLAEEFVKSAEPNQPNGLAHNVPSDEWQYGFGTYNEAEKRVTDFTPFPFCAGNQWKGGPLENDPMLGRMQLNARGGFAGPDSKLSTIRRWIAPRDGLFTIKGRLSSNVNSTQPLGDGVRGRIVSSRAGLLGVWIVHGTEEVTDCHHVEAKVGDVIDFVADARGRDAHATFTWTPVLRLAGVDQATAPLKNTKDKAPKDPRDKVEWDAAKDFKATPVVERPSDVWERLAQVLLQSNEFVFVD